MFAIYSSNHPAGFSANVVQTAANKGVLLALVAMAQTFVVITAGIDLSVGMVFVLTNCLASWIVVGTAGERRARRRRRPPDRSRVRRDQRAHRHLRPAAADRRHHRQRRGVLRLRPSVASGSGRRRVRAARRRPDRTHLRRFCRRAWSRSAPSFWSFGFPIADRRSAGRPTRSARPRPRPTCRAFRSAPPSSAPIYSPDWPPRSAASF